MNQPLVSIIIRTCGRPQVLKQALDSVRNQTYENIETIVVEDGINSSEDMVVNEFSDININYFFSGEKIGRSRIGNLGLEKVKGKYCNFLDDDDVLYENHVQCLVDTLEKSENKAAYSIAEEKQIFITSYEPYQYKVKRKLIRFKQPFNQILLYHTNYIPIQSIMFEYDLFKQAGGFDENLDALEDWDLWVRYSTLGNFIFLDRVTSAYYVIYKRKEKINRDKRMHDVQNVLKKKFYQYNFSINAGQVYDDMDYIIKKYKTGNFKRYLRLIADFLIYGER